MQYLELPRSLAIGEFIAFVHDQMNEKQHLDVRYTFSGAAFFNRMKALDLYVTDPAIIRERVNAAGLTGIFNQSLV